MVDPHAELVDDYLATAAALGAPIVAPRPPSDSLGQRHAAVRANNRAAGPTYANAIHELFGLEQPTEPYVKEFLKPSPEGAYQANQDLARLDGGSGTLRAGFSAAMSGRVQRTAIQLEATANTAVDVGGMVARLVPVVGMASDTRTVLDTQANTSDRLMAAGGLAVDVLPAGRAVRTAIFGRRAVDAVDEIKVQSAAADASYGRTSGGVVNLVLKSGGNDWRGTASWFLRDDALDANTTQNNRLGIAKQGHRFDNYSMVVRGPRMPVSARYSTTGLRWVLRIWRNSRKFPPAWMWIGTSSY